MAQVMFLTGVGDKLALALRLLRKKQREGGRVAVYGPPALLSQLDQALWAEVQLSFEPHVRLRGSLLPAPTVVELTPVWLLDRPLEALRCDSAINLGVDDAQLVTGVAKLAELVGLDEAERAAGRRRWKQYEATGHQLSHLPQ